jgi:hypothetical protein
MSNMPTTGPFISAVVDVARMTTNAAMEGGVISAPG